MIRTCPSPKARTSNAGFEFGSAASLHGEPNGAEAGKDLYALRRALSNGLSTARGASPSNID